MVAANSKVYGLIGLAAKAGVIITGSDVCERAIAEGKAKLVVIAEDSSENTKEKFMRIAFSGGVEVRLFGTCEALGHYSGKENRAVAVICDRGFAEKLTATIDASACKNGGGLIG